jgi:4-hydroxy-2-oxoheptanedioate aldolase
MAQNGLRQRWKEGKAAVNGWLAIPSAFAAEVMAQCGWDSVTVDLQHGVQDYHSMVACFQAMHAHPVTRLVRVPWNEPASSAKFSMAARTASFARWSTPSSNARV